MSSPASALASNAADVMAPTDLRFLRLVLLMDLDFGLRRGAGTDDADALSAIVKRFVSPVPLTSAFGPAFALGGWLKGPGHPFLGLALWRRLGLHSLLSDLIEPGEEEVPWPAIASVLTVARFCGQRSELGIAERCRRP